MPDSAPEASSLPLILAGPILRRASAARLTVWLVTSRKVRPGLALYPESSDTDERFVLEPSGETESLRIGKHAFVHCMDYRLGAGTPYPELPEDTPIGYDILFFANAKAGEPVIYEHMSALAYDGEARPRFVMRRQVTSMLHGSCRLPHHPSPDGLVRADDWLAKRRGQPDEWPTVLVLSGDQIYADDVAGPMLRAIHGLIQRLGLWGETIRQADVSDDQALFVDPRSYYRRSELLPEIKQNIALRDVFFGGTNKPVFTTANAGNHLITLSEVLAMYLLVWSDTCWQLTDTKAPELDAESRALYDAEVKVIHAFARGLPQVRRLLAHLPTAMIFDDHDVTDDWNLTANWEAIAYSHPFSRRIIGNALIGYFVCQGWCNQPEAFRDSILPQARALFSTPGCERHDQLIDALLRFENWHYSLPTEPAIIVMDSRTRRWRSERSGAKPSGLMDWEALVELQQALLGKRSAILISPAPIFGVKLIENIQRVFIWIRKPLMVDAENWMAHRGAATVLLQIFLHSKSPRNFTVLSGDVHYSFAYDVSLRWRGKSSRPSIWQITSSGVKNEFPEQLLNWFDRLNRWLFAPYSPLNWLTKRRSMHIVPRKPTPSARGERLVNRSGVGHIRFESEGRPAAITQLGADGVDVDFIPESERKR